eukprot:6183892-Pleurochrysis_carterae.AAC.2
MCDSRQWAQPGDLRIPSGWRLLKSMRCFRCILAAISMQDRQACLVVTSFILKTHASVSAAEMVSNFSPPGFLVDADQHRQLTS